MSGKGDPLRISASEIVDILQLSAHPEGGFYRQTHVSSERLPAMALPPRFGAERSCSTAIYYLLEQGDFSTFHRIKSDEVWHHYLGDALWIHMLSEERGYRKGILGNDLLAGEEPQCVVPAGEWFAAEPAPGSRLCLAGCTVAPVFSFDDLEMAEREGLCRLFPRQASLIAKLTRE